MLVEMIKPFDVKAIYLEHLKNYPGMTSIIFFTSKNVNHNNTPNLLFSETLPFTINPNLDICLTFCFIVYPYSWSLQTCHRRRQGNFQA